MNAVTIPTLINNPNSPNVPTSRFEPLSISASAMAELLLPLEDVNAKKYYAKITTIQPRLHAERLAAERATVALAEAKAEVRRINGISDTLISTAINVGRLFEFEDIVAFELQDEAWRLTVDGLVIAFRAHGELWEQFSDRFTRVLEDSRRADADLARATTEYARAQAAYSAEYRALAGAIAFSRALLTELGVEIPRVTPKKKAKAADSVPAPAPTPMPAGPGVPDGL